MSNHSFDIKFAEEYRSIEIAILIWHFQYWIIKNKRLGRNFIEGKTWTYQTFPEIAAAFPYWSLDQVKRFIKKMCDLDILVKGNFNKNPMDRTVWYAFIDEQRFNLNQYSPMEGLTEENSPIVRNRTMENAESRNGEGEIALCYKDQIHYPDTLTNKEEDISLETRAHPPTPLSLDVKKQHNIHYQDQLISKELSKKFTLHGECVRLKDGEYEKLCDELGEALTNYYIQAINNYVPNNKPYKDYSAVIRQWNLRDKAKGELPNLKKINNKPQSKECFELNKKLCEQAEQKLNRLFTSFIFFHAGPTCATLYHTQKDIQKIYDYSSYNPKELKESLLHDLEMVFPGAANILMDRPPPKISTMINELSEKYKMAEVT